MVNVIMYFYGLLLELIEIWVKFTDIIIVIIKFINIIKSCKIIIININIIIIFSIIVIINFIKLLVLKLLYILLLLVLFVILMYNILIR